MKSQHSAAGDAVDKGPGDIRVVKTLLSLKRRYWSRASRPQWKAILNVNSDAASVLGFPRAAMDVGSLHHGLRCSLSWATGTFAARLLGSRLLALVPSRQAALLR